MTPSHNHEIQKMKRFHKTLMDQFGYSHKTVGWFTKESQETIFRILCGIANLNQKTILDVGCGLGHLIDFLKDEFVNCAYTGIDFSEDLMEMAKREHPHHPFLTGDFFSYPFSETYDYVLASGPFNYRVKGQKKYIESAIFRMYSLANRGVAFNLTSLFCPENIKFKEAYYYDPVKIIQFCLTLTPYVVFKQNYMPEQFTIYMYVKKH